MILIWNCRWECFFNEFGQTLHCLTLEFFHKPSFSNGGTSDLAPVGCKTIASKLEELWAWTVKIGSLPFIVV